MSENPQYYYCIKHKTVEGRDGCRNMDRIGPFDTEEEAASVIDRVHARNEALDKDPGWNDSDD